MRQSHGFFAITAAERLNPLVRAWETVFAVAHRVQMDPPVGNSLHAESVRVACPNNDDNKTTNEISYDRDYRVVRITHQDRIDISCYAQLIRPISGMPLCTAATHAERKARHRILPETSC